MKPEVRFLSPEELERLHRAALDLLDRVGMRLPAQKAQEGLVRAGARLGGGDVVRIPPELVEEALAKAPRREEVVLHGRRPEDDFSFVDHRPALACMTMATSVIDPFSGKKRPADNDDLARLTRLADQLDRVAVNGGLVTPQEVPGAINDWYTWATTLKHTTKPITGGVYGARGVEDAVEMASLACGSRERFLERPFISGWVLTLPPLGIDRASLEALMELGRFKIPAVVSSGPILGTTSPVTLAGTMAQAHAEILACLTVSQTLHPGAPVIYTSFARGMDMKSGAVSMACPEFAVLKVGLAQLGRSLGLPVRMPAMLRDAKRLDAQAGFETGMVAGLTCLAADLMDGMQLDMDLVVDYPDLLFCDEAMAALRRLARPLAVDRDSLALEIIEEVGPGGSFLTHRHTFNLFRTELWQPGLFERRNWQSWEAEGAKEIHRVCLERVREMLAKKPEPLLPPEVEAAIDQVVERARADIS